MVRLDLRHLICRETGQEPVWRGGLWFMCCPFHADREPSLAIYADNHWHCYGCGVGGDGIAFIRRFRNMSFTQALLYLGEAERQSFPAMPVAVSGAAEQAKWAGPLGGRGGQRPVEMRLINYWQQELWRRPEVDYLFSRLFSPEILREEKFGWRDGYFAIPVWDDRHSHVLSVRFRASGNREPRYMTLKGFGHPLVYNAHLLVRGGDVAYWFFGELDALLARQDGLLAISQTGGKENFLPEWIPLFSRVRRVILVPDRDTGNKLINPGVRTELQSAVEIANHFGRRARVFRWPQGVPGKDYNEARVNGMSAGEFTELAAIYQSSP